MTDVYKFCEKLIELAHLHGIDEAQKYFDAHCNLLELKGTPLMWWEKAAIVKTFNELLEQKVTTTTNL